MSAYWRLWWNIRLEHLQDARGNDHRQVDYQRHQKALHAVVLWVSCVQAFTVTIKTPLTHSFMEDRQPPVYHTLLTTLRPATNKWRFLLGSSDDTKSIIGFAPRGLKKGANRPEAYPPSSPPPNNPPSPSLTDPASHVTQDGPQKWLNTRHEWWSFILLPPSFSGW